MNGVPLLVLHGFGDLSGGVPWSDAFSDAGWRGAVIAPDLPGHGTEGPPLGGHYDSIDAFVVGLRALEAAGLRKTRPVMVGVGTSGWAAAMLAVAGRASALALVDGLGGPWLDPQTTVKHMAALARAIAEDPLSVAPPPPRGTDPRMRHAVLPQPSLALARRMAVALSIPVAIVETPSSPSGSVVALELGELMRATIVEADAISPSTVAPLVVSALRERGDDAA